jgi:hypothetical protein
MTVRYPTGTENCDPSRIKAEGTANKAEQGRGRF